MRVGAVSVRLWAVMFACAIGPTAGAAQGCADDRVDLRGDWGSARFMVELADTPAERAQGLMFRDRMAPSHGMLFLYDAPQPVSFWMKNTEIPLDMLFVGADGRVTHVHENATPHDLTPIDGGDGVIAVLEINGGIAARYGLSVGDELRHPRLDQAQSAWPCEIEN